jgi:ketosteroid isomerase-like protein
VSRENVEIIRRANAAFNQGDVEEWAAYWASDAEFQDLANAPDQHSVVRGPEAIVEVAQLWLSAFDEFSADIEEYIGGGDFVICSTRWHGQGKASGMSLDLHQFDVYELQQGKIVHGTVGFKTKAEALKAAGLTE